MRIQNGHSGALDVDLSGPKLEEYPEADVGPNDRHAHNPRA